MKNVHNFACTVEIYLGIFVYECESIGNVVVTKMNHAGSDPGPDLLLGSLDDLVHSPPNRRSRLNPVETLQVKVSAMAARQSPSIVTDLAGISETVVVIAG